MIVDLSCHVLLIAEEDIVSSEKNSGVTADTRITFEVVCVVVAFSL